jgi:dTDP-glucose 4,6-dehydratase
MRVLVTGSAGFVGHYIVKKFVEEGCDVVGLDRLSYSGNLNRISEILTDETRPRYTVQHHDLRSAINESLANQLGQFDFIIHVAASSHVDRSIDQPINFVLDNVVGTCNILDFARRQKNLKKFIYFSTDEIFGPAPPGVAYDEYDRYNSTNPYSASKAGGEELCVAFRNTYKVPVVVTHTMNIFGPRQHPEKFVPMCISKVRDGEKIMIHSDETRTIPGSRYYIHVEDVAEAVWFLVGVGTYKVHGEPFGLTQSVDCDRCPKFNIVGKEELDNLTLAQYIAEGVGKPLRYELVDFHSARPGHDLRYALSGKRLAELGWEPKTSIRERIREVVEWTVANERWCF